MPPDAPSGQCPHCLLALAARDEILTGNQGKRSFARSDRRFGDYLLGRQIGAGGMGVVYEAQQVNLRQEVALKLIRDVHVASPMDLCRFTIEAEAAARLDHPNIVRIHEIGDCDEHPFISMDLIHGESLQEKTAKGEYAVPRREGKRASNKGHCPKQEKIVRLLIKTARAVHHAHERGVLHRDLKPGNILIDRRGEPHLTDFGLAKILQQPRDEQNPKSLTAPGDFLGTPSYMSPEQASGLKTTRASDIYGLGAILYQLLTGQPMFNGTTTLETFRLIAEHEPTRPRALNPAIAPDLETICLKCLEKDPTHRFSSAAALAEDLEHWLAGQAIKARRASYYRRTRQWIGRNRIGAAFIASLWVSLFIALALLKVVDDQRKEIQRDRDQTFEEGMNKISLIWKDPETKAVMISAWELAILAGRSPGEISQAQHQLYFGVSTEGDPSSMAQRYARWLSQLQQEMTAVLGQTVVFRMKLFKRFNPDEESLAQGDADLMVLSAVDFLKAQKMALGIVPLARDKSVQEAVVFAHVNSGVRQLADLRRKTVIFPDPDLSITVWAKARLSRAGLRAADFLAWTNILDHGIETDKTLISHTKTVHDVLQHMADAGVTFRDDFERYKHRGLVLLDSFPETPTVLASRPGLDPLVLKALRRVIQSGTGFSPRDNLSFDLPIEMVLVGDEDFADLRQAMRESEQFDGPNGSP